MKKTIIITILVLIILGLGSFIVYDNVIKKEEKTQNNFIEEKNDKEETTIEENKAVENEKNDKITLEILSSLIKTYYKNNPYNSNGFILYDGNNVLLWNITEASYLGYYKSDENIKYYELNGMYKCKDNKDNCVYMSQIGDDYYDDGIDYVAVIAVKREDGNFVIDHIDDETLRVQIKNDPEIKNDFEYVNERVN